MLSILEQVDVLRGALRLIVETHHEGWEGDQLTGVETSAVGSEVVNQLACFYVDVKRSSVA